MKTTRINQICPYCQAHHNCATMATSNKGPGPSPRDFTLCFKCGEICQFNDELQMVPPDPKEMADFEKNQPREFGMMEALQERIRIVKMGQHDEPARRKAENDEGVLQTDRNRSIRHNKSAHRGVRRSK